MQSHSSILCKAVFCCSACSLTFFCKSGAKVFRTTSRFPTSRDFDHWNRQCCPWLHLDRTWTSWMSHLELLRHVEVWMFHQKACSEPYCQPLPPARQPRSAWDEHLPNKISQQDYWHRDLSDVTNTYSYHLIPRNAMPNAYSHSIHSNWLSGPLQSTVKSLIDFRMLGGKSSVAP